MIKSMLRKKKLGWAENEVKIAYDKDDDYSNLCRNSALKAYKCLMKDNHSGTSMVLTKNILNRLIERKPLSPIYDIEDEWNRISISEDCIEYQSKRMPSLFKRVSREKITYHDIDRISTVLNNGVFELSLSNGFVSKIVDEIFPIEMPYKPYNKCYKAYCEELLSDASKKIYCDYDMIAILYIITPTGERKEINRFFKEINGEFTEISENEFNKKKKRGKAK